MWAKIVAGAAAACAVVGVGIYFATPSNEGGCNRCRLPAVVSDGGCSGDSTCSEHSTSCPFATSPQVDSTALAACAGGMTVQPAPTKFACCSE